MSAHTLACFLSRIQVTLVDVFTKLSNKHLAHKKKLKNKKIKKKLIQTKRDRHIST
jgi:hypothetical protein